MKSSYGGWEWVKDRLATVETWRLVLFLVFPLGSSAFFAFTNLVAGRIGWAVFFGLLVALEVAIVIVAWIVRFSRSRQTRADSN
jgi:hypothetical protein